MMCRTIVVLAIVACGCVSAVDEDAWGPPDSVQALGAVIGMVDKLVKSAKTPEALKKAQVLAADVKADIEAVEGGNLTKAQAHDKVGAAIKELTAFETQLSKPPPMDPARAQKLAELEKKLAEKKAELAKDENMIKLFKLKKELAEKRLRLQGLLDSKKNQEKNAKADQAEAAKTNDMVKSLVSMAKNSGLKAKEEMPAPMKAILASVESQRVSVADDLKKMEAEEKAGEAKIDGALGKGADAQSQGMLKRLKKEQHRKFAKAQALKRIELNELKDAEASVESGDIAGLQKTLAKIEQEGKALQAKAGNLY
jgi:hypothetical protein